MRPQQELLNAIERLDVETRSDLLSHRRPAPLENNSTAAICITGMHRSGTSMVARLLHACGASLGPEDELNQPAPHNREGQFENVDFVQLNEDILAQFGGSWDDPPRFPPGWEFTPQASSFLERGENLVGRFRRHNWGWKDPRNALTLPFWLRLNPDMKVVVCLRNPLEVAHSLFLRGDSISTSEFQLWLTYYRQLLSATPPTRRLITHYQSYFQNARAEVRRVLDWLALEVSEEAIERACAHISVGLRHHRVTTAELIELDVPDEVLGLYWSLCAEAGPIYQQVRKHERAGELKHPDAQANEVSLLRDELQQLRSSCADELQQLKSSSAARERTLNEILNSKSFRLVSLYWRLRRRK
jgi:hypothetical protein